MFFRNVIFSLLAGILLAVSPARVYGEDKIHTVQRGETLFSIARVYGIQAEDLMKHNGITDPNRLLAGQRLKIPEAVTRSGTGGVEYTSYRAVRGDTLYSIARKYSVTLDTIRSLNSLPENYVLRVGDALRVPVAGGAESRAPAAGAGSGDTRTVPSAPAGTTNVPAVPNPAVIWPVIARDLSYMTGKLSGVVITGARAEPVKSLTRGTVISAGPFQGFSRVAIIQVEGGYLYVYGGCESLSVKEGDRVGPGTELGKLGIDSKTNKPQLFFMVYRSNTPVDPARAPRA